MKKDLCPILVLFDTLLSEVGKTSGLVFRVAELGEFA